MTNATEDVKRHHMINRLEKEKQLKLDKRRQRYQKEKAAKLRGRQSGHQTTPTGSGYVLPALTTPQLTMNPGLDSDDDAQAVTKPPLPTNPGLDSEDDM